MHHKIAALYRRELPFIIPPLLSVLVGILIIRFLVIPQFYALKQTKSEVMAIPALAKEKRELLERLSVAAHRLPKVPAQKQIAIPDESSLVRELLAAAHRAGITLSRTSPTREEGAFVVQTAFSATWSGATTFLCELERYPDQIFVSQVAINQRGSLMDITLTIRSIASGETQ